MKKEDTKGSKKIKNLKSLNEIPKFTNEKEEVEFWKSHRITDLLDQLPSESVELSNELEARIKANKNKKQVTIRLYPEQIKITKEIALSKRIGYLTLISSWVQEGIEREKGKKEIAELVKDLRNSIEHWRVQLQKTSTDFLQEIYCKRGGSIKHLDPIDNLNTPINRWKPTEGELINSEKYVTH